MKQAKGDLVELAKQGEFDVIAHGCNCFCTMGAGLAEQIKREFPEAYEADLHTVAGDKGKLGTLSVAFCDDHELIVVNAYTQYDYGSGRSRDTDYDAIRQVFSKMNRLFEGRSLGIPKIGAGLGGGDWSEILDIAWKELRRPDVTIVLYDK